MQRQRGFTLVELMVALFAMALLAILSWRGIDGMVRSKEITQQRADEVLALQVGLSQWSADFDAITELRGMKALDWNGRVMRLTRRSSASPTDGVLVVGWTLRAAQGRTMWLRWQSMPVTTRGQIEEAWQRADQWARNPGSDDLAREVAIVPLDEWQLFYFRDNAWTNPQSSDVTSTSIVAAVAPAAGASAPANPASVQNLPDGVRLVITLAPGQAISGAITRDWVRPLGGGGKG